MDASICRFCGKTLHYSIHFGYSCHKWSKQQEKHLKMSTRALSCLIRINLDEHSFLCQHYPANKSHICLWIQHVCYAEIYRSQKGDDDERSWNLICLNKGRVCVCVCCHMHYGCWWKSSFSIVRRGINSWLKWSAAMLNCSSPLSRLFLANMLLMTVASVSLHKRAAHLQTCAPPPTPTLQTSST